MPHQFHPSFAILLVLLSHFLHRFLSQMRAWSESHSSHCKKTSFHSLQRRIVHRVVGIITAKKDYEKILQELATQLLEKKLVHGVCWLVNTRYGDTSEGETVKEWGDCTLREKMSGIELHYSFSSFFQTNPEMAEQAQQYVLQRLTPGKKILDLFCGVGTFSIPIAAQADYLVGIEHSTDSIQNAKENAMQLPLRNTSFIAADVAKYLPELETKKQSFDSIVADPPRAGLSKKILRRLLRLSPKQIIYISCNPTSLHRDLKWLEEYCDFSITHSAIFDFFPHTEHVETIVDIIVKEIYFEKLNTNSKIMQ